MRLKAKITYPSTLVLNLQGFAKGGSAAQAVLMSTMTDLAIKLQVLVKLKLSGEVLNVRSGALRRSIGYSVVPTPAGPTASVFSRGVPYAAIHEFGGTTKPHLIEAKNAQALRFYSNRWAMMIYRKSVNHPGSVIPERSYLRSALREMEPEIRRELLRALIKQIGVNEGYILP